MLRRTKIVMAVAVLASGAILGTAAAQTPDSKTQDKLGLGEDDVKQLVLLMDADKNGKISKDEYMKFMAAEFDRLDKDKSGELDVKELKQSMLRVARPAHGRR